MNAKNLIATLRLRLPSLWTLAALMLFMSVSARAVDLGNNAELTAVQQTDGSGTFAATHRIAYKFTSQTTDTLQDIYFYFLYTGNYSVNVFLLDTNVSEVTPYNNNVGDSNTILVSTNSLSMIGAGWKSISVNQALTTGHEYWIVMNYTASSGGATNCWSMVTPAINGDVATGQTDNNQIVLYSTGTAVQWQNGLKCHTKLHFAICHHQQLHGELLYDH